MKKRTAAIPALAMAISLCACAASGGIGAGPSAGETGFGTSRKLDKPAADTPEGILGVIADDYEATAHMLHSTLEEISAEIHGDYENYVEKRRMIDDWYTQAETETSALFQRTEENCRQYFILMSAQTEHTYRAMNKAADKIYEDVYEDAREDFYDDIYDGLMEELYDEYYDGILAEAYDLVPYKEYSEQRSYFYETWADARSELYRLVSDHGRRLYEMYSAVTKSIYKEDYDFAAVLERDAEKAAAKAAEKARKSGLNDSPPAADAPEKNGTAASDGASIRPEFKRAMDSYEAFFTEFAEFIQALSDDAGNLTLLAKYADYMAQYTETMEALDSIDTDELTTEELSYYLGVMSRIQQMLLTAADE